MIAIFGAHNLSNPFEPGRIVQAPIDILIHHDYDSMTNNFDADLSLLEFEEGTIAFSSYVQPVCLPDTEIELNLEEALVAGWGMNENGILPTVPKQVKTPIASNERCFSTNEDAIAVSSERTFCAGSLDGSGICRGDSGAGVVIKADRRYYLRGIASVADVTSGKCNASKYAVYVNVLNFVAWIIEKTDKDRLDKAR